MHHSHLPSSNKGKPINLNQLRFSELVNLFIESIKEDNHSLISAIFEEEPLLLKYATAEQRLNIFEAALKQHYYAIARDVLNYPFDIAMAIKNILRPYCWQKEDALSLIHLGFIRDLVSKKPKIFTEEHCHLIDTINNLGILQEFISLYKLNESNQQNLEDHLLERITRYFYISSYKELFEPLKTHGYLNERFIKLMEKYYSGAVGNNHFLLFEEFPDFPKLLNPTSLNRANDQSISFMLNVAINSPHHAKTLAQQFSQLHSIEFYDRGQSRDAWWRLTDKVISLAPAPKKTFHSKLSDQLSASELKEAQPKKLLTFDDYLPQLEASGWKFLRCQGRTILVEKQGEILAIKVQKENEESADLLKQFHAEKVLREEKLAGYVPESEYVGNIKNILPWLKNKTTPESLANFEKMVGFRERHTVYIYRVDAQHRDYFTYLHSPNISDQEFIIALRKIISDLCNLTANGIIYTQLADIFHNSEETEKRSDSGRYIVLTNLLSLMALYTGPMAVGPMGSGRITDWKRAIEYVNLRATGCADYGDYIPLQDLFTESEWVRKHFSDALRRYKNKTGNYLLANVLAEQQFIIFLSVGRRAADTDARMKEQKQSEDAISQMWEKQAHQVIDNCVLMISKFNGKTEQVNREYLLTQTDVKMLARQMESFMTDEYILYFMANTVPPGTFSDKTKVTVALEKFREGTFNPDIGCSINAKYDPKLRKYVGDQDLGPVNGPEPIKEANKLFHKTIDAIFAAYHEYRLTKEDVAKLAKAKTPAEREALENEVFSHLPKKKYHGMMFSWNKRKLLDEKLNGKEQRKAIESASQHKLIYTALTLQTMWRKKQEALKIKKLETSPSLATNVNEQKDPKENTTRNYRAFS